MPTPPVYDLFALTMKLDPRVARILTGSDKGIGPESTASTISPGVVTGAQSGGSGSSIARELQRALNCIEEAQIIIERLKRSTP
jgi:hypothetical protein